MLIAVLVAILVVLPGLRFPGQNFVQYCEAILGRILGRATALLFVLCLMILMPIILREFGDLLINAIFPRTPLSVFIGFLLIVSAIAVYYGITVISRTAELLAPLVFGFILLTLLLSLNRADFSNLAPVLEMGWKPVFSGVMSQMPFMPQVVIVAFLLGNLEKPESVLKATLGYVGLVGGTLMITSMIAVAVFSGEYASTLFSPFLSLARGIVVTSFVTEIEAVVVAVWILGGFVRVSLTYYVIVSTLGQILGLKDHRHIILPVGLIGAALSIMMFSNSFQVANFISKTMSIYHPIVFIGIPLLLLIVSVIRKKGNSTTETLQQGFQDIESDLRALSVKIKKIYFSIVMPVDSDL